MIKHERRRLAVAIVDSLIVARLDPVMPTMLRRWKAKIIIVLKSQCRGWPGVRMNVKKEVSVWNKRWSGFFFLLASKLFSKKDTWVQPARPHSPCSLDVFLWIF